MELSIVVPTKNEAENIEPLLTRIEQAMDGIRTEVVFVDDSSDETPQRVRELRDRFPMDISLIVRTRGYQNGGLGGAVVEGLRVARGHWVCVMDADLQHPPEMIPRLLSHAKETRADVVLGSRLAEGGSTAGLGWRRSVVSRCLAMSVRALFWRRLREVSDPMTGLFVLRRRAVDLDRLRPEGFKILLEILVRCPGLRVSEVAFQFASRHTGRSKAGLSESLRLLHHLLRLADLGFPRFLRVGASGFIVNNLVLALFTELVGVYYLISAVLATQSSTLWNFSLTEAWVFADRQQSGTRLQRLGMFLLINNSALGLRGPVIYILTSGLGIHYLVSNIISLIVLTLLRYAVADRWIWRKAPAVERLFDASTCRVPELTPQPSASKGEYRYAPRIHL